MRGIIEGFRFRWPAETGSRWRLSSETSAVDGGDVFHQAIVKEPVGVFIGINIHWRNLGVVECKFRALTLAHNGHV